MQIFKKLSICGVLVAACCYLVPALGTTVLVPGVGKLTPQDLNSSNDYVGGVTRNQGTPSGSVVQPKIAQPQIAGVANGSSKSTEQPDSNIVYVLKKKAKNKFGGSERQANTLKKYLGVNY